MELSALWNLCCDCRTWQEFCKLTELSEDAKAEVNRVASDVWFSYLERLLLPPSCGYSGIHVRDQFRWDSLIWFMSEQALSFNGTGITSLFLILGGYLQGYVL